MDCTDSRLLKSQVVLLCGISGSGKTTFARRLVEEGFTRLSADGIIWEHYGDDFPTLPADVKKRAFMQVNAELEKRLARQLLEGKRVVVDATLCKRDKRDRLRRVCSALNADASLVWFDVAADTLRERLAIRKGIGPDDQIVAPEQLAQYTANFERPTPDENPLTIR